MSLGYIQYNDVVGHGASISIKRIDYSSTQQKKKNEERKKAKQPCAMCNAVEIATAFLLTPTVATINGEGRASTKHPLSIGATQQQQPQIESRKYNRETTTIETSIYTKSQAESSLSFVLQVSELYNIIDEREKANCVLRLCDRKDG